MKTFDNVAERRNNNRSKCIRGARILPCDSHSALDCRIRDESGAGLRLSTQEPNMVPDSFMLVRDGSKQGQVCKVTWRSQTEIGAEVVLEVQLAPEVHQRSHSPASEHQQLQTDRYPV